MPRLACYVCGRTLWSATPLDQLFAEERRCPRCGAALKHDRRAYERRAGARRQGQPATAGRGGGDRRVDERRPDERRVGERRVGERRRPDGLDAPVE